MRFRRTAIVILIFLLAQPLLFAQEDNPAVGSMPRLRALGGFHASAVEGIDALILNPAALRRGDSEFAALELTAGVSGPVFSILSVVTQAQGGDIASVLSSPAVLDLLSNINVGAGLDGPLSFGFAGNGLGFGIFNRTLLNVENLTPTSLLIEVTERVTLRGAYAVRLLDIDRTLSLDLGVGLYGIVAGGVQLERSILQIADLVSSLNADLLLGQAFSVTSGIGLDLALEASLRDVLVLSLTGANVVSPNVTYTYDTADDFIQNANPSSGPVAGDYRRLISFSAGFTPSLGRLERYLSGFAAYFTYRDIFDFILEPATAENIFLKFSLGTEVTLLDVLDIRLGFGEGLLAAGLGLDLSAFRLHLSVFGAEESIEPGLRPTFNTIFGLQFRY